MELSGCGTALVTPFLANGAVDEASLVRLVNWQIESGINFLIPCGTTGEASTLNEAEWLRVVEVTVKRCRARAGVLGMHSQRTSEAVVRGEEAGEGARSHAHPDRDPLQPVPGAGGPGAGNFRAIAEAVELPILLYNIPVTDRE